jgi:hypothetical protein
MRNRQTNFVAKPSLILIAALALSGCAVGPNYHRPAVQTPPAFHGLTNCNRLSHKPHRSPICHGGKYSTIHNCKT